MKTWAKVVLGTRKAIDPFDKVQVRGCEHEQYVGWSYCSRCGVPIYVQKLVPKPGFDENGNPMDDMISFESLFSGKGSFESRGVLGIVLAHTKSTVEDIEIVHLPVERQSLEHKVKLLRDFLEKAGIPCEDGDIGVWVMPEYE